MPILDIISRTKEEYYRPHDVLVYCLSEHLWSYTQELVIGA